MKSKVYIETTMPSYLAGRPSRDLLVAAHQQITLEWWETRRNLFDLYISELVLREISSGDAALANRRLEFLSGIPIMDVGHEIHELSSTLILEGPIPSVAAPDATHIATATAYGCDYLLTWNCRHIANAEIRQGLRRAVERFGFELPILCTTEELMGEQI
jgi:PIN domain